MNLTYEERTRWIGVLAFQKRSFGLSTNHLEQEVLDRMIDNTLGNGGTPLLEKYYTTSHEVVRKLFHGHDSDIWGYLSDLAGKNKQNIFEYLGKYYTGYSGYSYDYFGVLVINTYLYERSREIIADMKSKNKGL